MNDELSPWNLGRMSASELFSMRRIPLLGFCARTFNSVMRRYSSFSTGMQCSSLTTLPARPVCSEHGVSTKSCRPTTVCLTWDRLAPIWLEAILVLLALCLALHLFVQQRSTGRRVSFVEVCIPITSLILLIENKSVLDGLGGTLPLRRAGLK